MMRRLVAIGFVLATFGPAPLARAQARRVSPERFWFGVSGGAQTAVSRVDDAFELPVYAEPERVTVGYPGRSGALLAASGGYRVRKRFTIGLGLTHYSARAPADVKARVPHPFFDNQFRDVEGRTSTSRGETGAHLLLGWVIPVARKHRLTITAGPSVLSVQQTVVTGVQVSEAYPYDTATFSGATTKRASRTAAGFNAGADFFWMFSRRVGAGGLMQVTRARVRENTGAGRSIKVDAGGAQAGMGLRFVF